MFSYRVSVDVVTDSMQVNITSGKYVNLVTLLILDMDALVPENMGAPAEGSSS